MLEVLRQREHIESTIRPARWDSPGGWAGAGIPFRRQINVSPKISRQSIFGTRSV